MARKFIRHNIVGSEVSRPRPIAYLRRGWPRRPAARRRGLSVWVLLAVLTAGLVAAQVAGG